MKYKKSLLAKYNKFYRRLLYNQSLEDVIIVYEKDLFSIRVVNDEVHKRSERGLELMKRVLKLGLR